MCAENIMFCKNVSRNQQDVDCFFNAIALNPGLLLVGVLATDALAASVPL